MSHDRKPGRVRVVGTTEPASGTNAAATGQASGPSAPPRAGAKRADRTPLMLALLFLAGAAAGGIGTVASGLAR